MNCAGCLAAQLRDLDADGAGNVCGTLAQVQIGGLQAVPDILCPEHKARVEKIVARVHVIASAPTSATS